MEQSYEIIPNSDQPFPRRILKNSFKSIRVQKNLPPPCFSTDQNSVNNFWKRSNKEQSCEIIPNSDKLFQKRRFLKNFFKSTRSKEPPPHGGHVFRRIRISRTIFEKGHPRNYPVTLLYWQPEFLMESNCATRKHTSRRQQTFWRGTLDLKSFRW